MKYFTKKWENKVRDYCDSQYAVIEVEPGDINYYYRCHLIAAHYATEHGHEKLALVVYRSKKNLLPCVHFLNYDGINFIDNSIGHWSKEFEYRFIRWVNKKEMFETENILADTKKFFSDMSTFFCKTFGDISN